MKRLFALLWNASPWKTAIVLCVLGVSVAFAAAYTGTNFSIDSKLPAYLRGGLFVGPLATANTLNRVTAMPGCLVDYDFAAITAAPGYEQLTPSYPCVGVKLGDPCSVGVAKATPNDGGSAWEQQVNFDAIAKADDVIVIKLTTTAGDGGAMNPPDAGYNVRCFSNVVR